MILRRIGRGGGQQIINLQDPGCTDSGTIIHEFIHGWGFWHEHARPDRDDYVKIYLDRVKDHRRNSFKKQNMEQANLIGEYDLCSIMHYKLHASRKVNVK